MAPPAKLSALQEKIVPLLQANPAGMDIHEIRAALPADIGPQQHLDKRVRDIRYFYELKTPKAGRRTLYVIGPPRSANLSDAGFVSSQLRAKLLKLAAGRCQMCGRTVKDDGIKFEIDHKIPRNWGGLTVEENLWAICSLCNSGKRDFFATLDNAEMTAILAKPSVHERIAETLRLHEGKETAAWLLEFVANYDDFQEDWRRRLRELRYPGIDWVIKVKRRKNPQGRVQAFYILQKHKPLPDDFHDIIVRERKKVSDDDDAD
jgi:hypothetical protein